MAIIKERYGIRPDDNPVVETSTYIESTQEHPMAVQIEGVPGWWVRIGVGNSLTALNARPVTYTEYQNHAQEHRLRVEAIQEDLDRKRDLRQRELDAKKDQVKAELRKLGLSEDTVSAILDQVRE